MAPCASRHCRSPKEAAPLTWWSLLIASGLATDKRFRFSCNADIVSSPVHRILRSLPPMNSVCRAAVIIVFALSLTARASFAQQDASDLQRKVDQVFAAYDKPDSPGCALGVVRDGAFIYKKGYGTASLELGVPRSE